MFDAPYPGPPKKHNFLKRPTIVSWALHSYWFINTRTVKGGDYSFRYRLKHWPHEVSVAKAEEYCARDPLSYYPQLVAASRE